MQKMIAVLFGLLVMALAACTEKSADMPDAGSALKTGKFHGDSTERTSAAPKITVVESLKKNSLNGYPQKKIGEAFDAYSKLTAKEWRESRGKDGKYYVDYFGWLPEQSLSPAAKAAGVVKQGLNIKFAVQKDGTTYVTLGTKLSQLAGGKVQTDVIPLNDVDKLLGAIYADREFTF